MGLELTTGLLDLFGAWAPWVALAVARPFGFSVFFMAFQWAQVSTGMIRMAFAVALALPALQFDPEGRAISELSMPFMAALVKEVAIGGFLGFIASVPLAIAVGAGGILDFYRGATQGSTDPSGGQVTAIASLMAVSSLWIFASIGGFWTVSSIIYTSYAAWPVTSAFPVLTQGAGLVIDMVERIITGSLVLCAPVLVILFLSDIVHLVSSKFGKNINVTHMAFSSKALIAVMVLPFFMLVALQSMRSGYDWLSSVNEVMNRSFQ
ncbi:MAG: flagellar biosynthetic protein FliR [Nitratireductor sp.]